MILKTVRNTPYRLITIFSAIMLLHSSAFATKVTIDADGSADYTSISTLYSDLNSSAISPDTILFTGSDQDSYTSPNHITRTDLGTIMFRSSQSDPDLFPIFTQAYNSWGFMASTNVYFENIIFSAATTEISNAQGNGKTYSFTNCVIRDHSSYYFFKMEGGSDNTNLFTNCLFEGNAKIFNHNYWSGSPTITIVNCTFDNNTEIFSADLASARASNVSIFNCIFSGNTTTFPSGDVLKGTTTYSLTSESTSNYGGNCVSDSDPEYVASTRYDPSDWVITESSSPAEDIGTSSGAPSTDIGGTSRGGSPDAGCWESGEGGGGGNDDYNDWSYSINIILNTSGTGADVSGNVTGFPVIIRLDPGNFSAFSQTKAGGADIRFASSGGTHLDYEIERWVDNGGDADSAWIWVKTDVTGDNSTQYIVMYWGNSEAADSSDADAVFSSSEDFMGTYHFNGDLISATGSNDGTNSSSVDTGGGIIGRARAFDGSSQYFHLGDLDDRSSGTISFWMRPKADFNSSSTTQAIYCKSDDDNTNSTLCLRGTDFSNGSGSTGAIITKIELDASGYYNYSTTTSWSSGTWYHVFWTWENGGGDSLYINGTLQGATTNTTAITGSGYDVVGICYHDDYNVTDGGPTYFNGTLDEFRIGTTLRSADWAKLCYENQQASQTLVQIQSLTSQDYTWDTETTSGIQPDDGTWGSNSYWTLTSGGGTSLIAWPGSGNSATFGGSDGTYAVTVSGTQYTDSISFLNSGYTLSGGTVDFGSAGDIHMGSGKSATISAAIAGSGGLDVSSGGSLSYLDLSGTNTYTGVTTIGSNVRLNVSTLADGGSNCAIGAASNSASNIVLDGGQLRHTGSGASTNRLFTVTTGGGCVYSSGSGAMNFTGSGSIAFSGSGTRTIEFGGAYTGGSNSFAPVIGDGTGGSTSITKTGSGNTWILSGNNTSTGTVTVSGGTLRLTGTPTSNALKYVINSGGSVSVPDRLNLSAYPGSTTADWITLNGGTLSTGIAIGENYGAYRGFTLGASGGTIEIPNSDNSNTVDIQSVITGSGALTKTGVGTLTLSATNTYTGNTTVSNGTLLVTGSTSSSSAVSVSSGATLGGTGTLNGTMAADGAIAPGTTGYGTLTIGNSITFSSSGSFEGTIGGTTAGTSYDQLVMSTGTLDLDDAELDLTLSYTPSASHSYTIINNQGSNAVSNTFDGYSEGSSVILSYSATNYEFTISYTGGTGNDVVLTCVGEAGGADDYGNWDYSCNIILNTSGTGADVSGSVSDFPVLIRLDPGNFDYFDETEPGGHDIRFASSGGTHLDYYIERWDDNGSDLDSAEIWVRTDVTGGSGSQYIVMYWGKTGAADSSNSGEVFDTENGFVGVYHMNQTSGDAVDVTSNGLDGSANGGITYSEDGNIYLANGFDGDGDYFDAGNDTKFDMSADDKVTVSAWVNRTGPAATSSFEGIAGSYEWTSGNYREYCLFNHATNGFAFFISPDGTYANETALYSSTVPDNETWYHVTAMMDGSNMYIFVNGDQKNSAAQTVIYGSTNSPFCIGKVDDDGDDQQQYFNGLIDEVRVENTNRSTHWIKLCYENQKSGQTLVELQEPSENYDDWSYSTSIILNTTSSGANVSGSVSDFPVLIRLDPGNFSAFSQTKAGGADIRFASSGGTHLPYEIERWVDGDGDADSAWIWVKTDVTGNNSTQYIVMYWGNGSATSKSDGEAVFETENDFVGVYHLTENGNNTSDGYANATGSNHGTGSNMTTESDVGAVVGTGCSFDAGSSQYITTADTPFDLTDDFTLSTWIYTSDATGDWARVIDKLGRWTTGYGIGGKEGTYGFVAYWSSSGWGSDPAATLEPLSDATWYYVSVTLNSGTAQTYRNGASVATFSDNSGETITTNNSSMTFGKSANETSYWTGSLDEIRIEDTPRSSDWIKLCYENQRTDQTLVELQAIAGDYTWDTETTSGIQTGSGTWGSNDYWTFTAGDGTQLSSWGGAGNSATFGGSDGTYTITISGTRNVDSITFLNSGYTLSGGTAINLGSEDGIFVAEGKSATISTPVTGTGGLTKSGTGTLTLSGTNTYSSATTVSGGTLNLTGSTGASSAVTVAAGATLTGTGTANSSLTVNGTFAPGTSPGTFYASGGLSFSGSATCEVEINGTTAGTQYDQIVVTGTVSLGLGELSVSLGYEPSEDDAFTIISNDGSEAITGTFAGISDDDTIVISYSGSDYLCGVSYNSGSNSNDVVLTILGEAVPDDYNDWSYSANIILNTSATGADVSGSVSDFPALIRLDPGNFSGFAQTSAGGADLRFASSGGTHLPYEIERWVDGGGDSDSAWIWVKADVAGDNSTQYIVMYWGNAGAADSSDAEAVFDTDDDFETVYHLNENPAGGADAIKDRTSNEADGTPNGSMTSGDAIGGQIGTGIDFDGSDDYLSTTASTNAGTRTLSAWIYPHTSDDVSHIESVIDGDVTGQFGNGWGLDNGYISVVLDDEFWGPAQAVSLNQWQYVTLKFNATKAVLYYNGLPVDSLTYTQGSVTSTRYYVGRSHANALYFDGIIDELRVSDAFKSADWIKLCYENQKSGQTLVEFPEDYADWGYSRNLVINTDGVISTNNCLGFPLLVRLDGDDFDFTQAQSGGEDIRFAKSDGKHLYYEIEDWDNSGETAEIWVKIDTVYHSNGSQYITMYWGNATVSSRSDGEAVFGTPNNYSGVWHLKEEGNTTAYDATAANNDGTSSGFTTSSDVPGTIGTGREFNGAGTGGDYIELNNNLIEDVLSTGDKKTTISFWFKADATTATKMIIWEGDGNGNGWGDAEELHFGLGASFTATAVDDYLTLYFGDGNDYNTSGDPLHAPTAFTDVTNWCYAAVTIDNTSGSESATLYLDGSSVATDGGTVEADFSGWDTNTRIGRPGADARYFDGKLDEVIIADTTRSADWIKLCFHTQKSDADVVTFGESDEFLPLTIEEYAPGGVTDTIGVSTDNWAIRFDKDAGGGIDYLDSVFSAGDQVDANLFYVIFDGNSSASGTGTLALFEWNTVFAGIRQQVTLGSQPFTIDYYVLGSGRMYVQVELTAASTISNKNLEFRIDNDGTTSTDNTLVGDDVSRCEGIVRIDDDDGMYDLILSPYETWSSATTFTDNSSYAGLGNSGFDCSQGMTRTWEFMVDFSHRDSDSDDAETYIDNYRNSDTLSFYAGTPLLEQAWEEHLKGHWSCDEGEDDTAFDMSGQGHTGLISGTPSWTTGQWGGGLELDGSTNYITVDNHSDFYGDNGRTIMAWIQPSEWISTSDIIFGKYSGGNVGYKFTGGGTSGRIRYTINNGGTPATLEGTTALTPGTWYHVTAMENHRRTTLKVFVNGEIDNISTGSYLSYYGTNSTDVTIGQGLDGVIDDVRFYNGHLDDNDIKAVYTKGFSPDKGMYSVRASNDNTVHCIMHGSSQQRSLPVLQIKNYWAATTPSYVYLDGEQLSSGDGEYIVSLDDNRKRLTIAFNKVISSDKTLFIDDNSAIGYLLTGPTKKMYWGIDDNGVSEYFWVKNTPNATFGSESDNEFYMNWKMSTSAGNDGELWHLGSSVTSPSTQIDTTTLTNLAPESNYSACANNTFKITDYFSSSANVSAGFTYTVEESSTVRVRLRINERYLYDDPDGLRMLTRWTIYPTGQCFKYDSIWDISGSFDQVNVNFYFEDSNTGDASSDNDDLRGGIIYDGTNPDAVFAWLSMRNGSGAVTEPFTTNFTYNQEDDQTGVTFYQYTDPPTQWSDDPVQSCFFMGIMGDTLTSIDPVSEGVQNQTSAISMTTGTLTTSSAGDLNTDGFNETEGAYVMAATGNTVKFTLSASSSVRRYYPAFRITNYLASQKPQYVYTGTSNILVEGYQYNSYLNQGTRELVIHLDTILTGNTTIYISADRTLAVQMSNFEAHAGNRCDTLLWRTESEHENLGYRLVRRINPAFYDSALQAYETNDSAAAYGIDEIGVPRLFKRGILKAADTGWVAVNKKLIPGAPSGASFGPRDYRYVDHRLHNDVLYEYKLIAVDYDHTEETYGPVQAMPRYVFPTKFALGVNYPNPFRYATKIRFALPVEAAVSLDIFTLNGRLVRRLITPDRKLPAMYHQILWDGTDDFGRHVATGPYVYRMTSGRYMKAKIMFMVR